MRSAVPTLVRGRSFACVPADSRSDHPMSIGGRTRSGTTHHALPQLSGSRAKIDAEAAPARVAGIDT